ncbi:hypothetical protein Tdes44962_MAKER05499 [Teratosphaeria destructans]|uniref:Uncharacterized protein n=1 Tax=Teratosphaeria destructans TaxID=418781 RepID=A0A9W7SK90_9PEZI|nr:hypothetical protein Tdes44962_MAKER05499 [Teratosphaeria destructans]
MLTMLFSIFFALLSQTCLASFGTNWGSGPVVPYKTRPDGTMVPDPAAATNNKIIFAQASIVLPETPTGINGVKGNLPIWLGLGTYHLPYGCLIQGIINHYPSSYDPKDPCGDLGTGRWCITAFILSRNPNFWGENKIAKTGQTVTATCKMSIRRARWQRKDLHQAIQIRGSKIPKTGVSTWPLMGWLSRQSLQAKAGYANGFGFANECTTKPCGWLEAHEWFNISLILQDPDPTYDSTHGTRGWNPKGVWGGIHTKDGGTTWTSDRIHMLLTIL